MALPIYPCLWFDKGARAGAELYLRAFPGSRITTATPMVVTFELHAQQGQKAQKFMALNGGPQFSANPSISFYVTCEHPDEIEIAWKTLLEGGSVLMPIGRYPWSERYGWLQDRYGVTWQISLGKLSDVGRKIAPFLTFTGKQYGNAAAAVAHYTSILENSSVHGILKYGKGEAGTEGTVKHAQFNLGECVMMATDAPGDHKFEFNEGVSLVVECATQQEIDRLWARLTEGGAESSCGWLRDRFGGSWQIVPEVLGKLMSDPVRAPRVVQAFLKMKKFDIETLLKA